MTCHIDWTRESNFSSVLSAGITRYRVGAMMRWCGGLPVRLFGRGDDLDGSCFSLEGIVALEMIINVRFIGFDHPLNDRLMVIVVSSFSLNIGQYSMHSHP